MQTKAHQAFGWTIMKAVAIPKFSPNSKTD